MIDCISMNSFGNMPLSYSISEECIEKIKSILSRNNLLTQNNINKFTKKLEDYFFSKSPVYVDRFIEFMDLMPQAVLTQNLLDQALERVDEESLSSDELYARSLALLYLNRNGNISDSDRKIIFSNPGSSLFLAACLRFLNGQEGASRIKRVLLEVLNSTRKDDDPMNNEITSRADSIKNRFDKEAIQPLFDLFSQNETHPLIEELNNVGRSSAALISANFFLKEYGIRNSRIHSLLLAKPLESLKIAKLLIALAGNRKTVNTKCLSVLSEFLDRVTQLEQNKVSLFESITLLEEGKILTSDLLRYLFYDPGNSVSLAKGFLILSRNRSLTPENIQILRDSGFFADSFAEAICELARLNLSVEDRSILFEFLLENGPRSRAFVKIAALIKKSGLPIAENIEFLRSLSPTEAGSFVSIFSNVAQRGLLPSREMITLSIEHSVSFSALQDVIRLMIEADALNESTWSMFSESLTLENLDMYSNALHALRRADLLAQSNVNRLFSRDSLTRIESIANRLERLLGQGQLNQARFGDAFSIDDLDLGNNEVFPIELDEQNSFMWVFPFTFSIIIKNLNISKFLRTYRY